MKEYFEVACALTTGFDRLVEACADLPDVRLSQCRDDDEAERALAKADGFIVYASRYTPRVARAVQASPIRWMHITTAGTDTLMHLPPPASIQISSGGDVWSEPVAEHAVALLLALKRNIHGAIRHVDDASWTRPVAIEALQNVGGSRALVVGFGHIGQAVARRLRALGADVTGVGRNAGRREGFPVRAQEELDSLIGKCESVVLCTPLTPATRGMVGPRQFALMEEDVSLVNISRGGVVDEPALLEGLRAGRPARAGLDVFAEEPLAVDHPLRALPNVILTPHVAGFGGGVLREVSRAARDNLGDVLDGRVPRNLIRLATDSMSTPS